MSYSVIIPTMWYQHIHLFRMVPRYDAHPLIGEILIINNRKHPTYPSQFTKWKKVRILRDGRENIFVNPAWNLGVQEAKCEKVIIANDDITIPKLDEVLQLIEDNLQEGQIYGFHRATFSKFKYERLDLDWNPGIIRPPGKYKAHGWGVFMVMYTSTWYVIPDEMKIWGGDTLEYHTRDPYLITGFEVITKMRGTSRKIQAGGKRSNDVAFMKAYMQENGI